MNATSNDSASLNTNETTSNSDINESTSISNDICPQQCVCDNCKDSSLDTPSTVVHEHEDENYELEVDEKSSSKPLVPTFGAYI